jgi:hypothetical protein
MSIGRPFFAVKMNVKNERIFAGNGLPNYVIPLSVRWGDPTDHQF